MSKFTEWKYWNIDRKTRKFVPWVARKLPAKLKYFVLVDAAVTTEPHNDPSGVTVVQMMNTVQGDRVWVN